ncbi:ABC transporter ATP-binding protein [Dethiothermospora halolimnae]|uniref:ABC transporter ATP-binding protein n=1 Tax=Dethiothermospora halolimnae TaxID=3114390 RepID=UPI003CCB9E9D
MTNTILELRNISKRYGDKKVLNDISLKVNLGDMILIKGSSGAGKSTLLNILAFLEAKDCGEIFWKGKNIDSLTIKEKKGIRKREMGFIFQEFNLFENLTVKENLDVVLSLTTKTTKEDRKGRIKEYLQKFQMEDRGDTYVKLLSGGERQRVAIVRTFLTDSTIVFADEPSANVDDKNKDIIKGYLVELKNAGKSIVIVSHDDYYDKIANRIYEIKNGYIKKIPGEGER